MRTRPRPGIMSDLVSISRLEKVNSSEATILPYFSSLLLRGNEGVTTEPLPLDVASLSPARSPDGEKSFAVLVLPINDSLRLQSSNFSMRNEKDTLAGAPRHTNSHQHVF